MNVGLPRCGCAPEEAGRLAEQVTGHLEAVEERAREAEVEAARAEVRVQGERKARKLTLALAAVVAAMASHAGSEAATVAAMAG